MRAFLPTVLLGSALALVIPGALRGQDMPYVDAVSAYNHANVMSKPLERSVERDRRAAPARRAGDLDPDDPRLAAEKARLRAALRFQPSSDVSRRIAEAIAAVLDGAAVPHAPQMLQAATPPIAADPGFRRLLARTLGDDRAQRRRTLDSGVLQRRFAQRLAAIGLSAHDLANAHHAFLAYSWAVANGRPRADIAAPLTAMRQRLLRELEREGVHLPSQTDAVKQQDAETLAVLTELLLAAADQAATAAERAAVRDGARALGRGFGIDYRAVVLDGRGFVRRTATPTSG